MRAPQFDRSRLIAVLRSSGDLGLTPAQIIDKMEVTEGLRRAFRQWLKVMQRQGVLRKGAAQRMLLRKTRTLTGRLIVSPRGFAFVDAPGGKSAFVAPGGFAGLLDGDEVCVDLIAGRKGDEGVMPTLVRRGRKHLVGRASRQRGGWLLDPDDRRIEMLIRVAGVPADLADGTTVRVRIEEMVEGDDAADSVLATTFLASLADVSAHDEALQRLAAEFGVAEPGPEAEAEAEGLGAAFDGCPRDDLTDLPFVTIDPPDAKDHDDALYARWTTEGVELFVAIADVAGFVRPGSALDQWAVDAGCSTYLPGQVVPMLPHRISGDLASLRAGVDRPVVYVRIDLDFAGAQRGSHWGLGTVRSRADLVYDDVQTMVDGGQAPEGLPEDCATGVQTLISVAKLLMAQRAKRGSLELARGELRFELDATGEPTGAHTRQARFAERVVEVAMVLANEVVGRRLLDVELPAPWRVHDKPPGEGLERFLKFAGTLGLTKRDQPTDPGSLSKMVERTIGKPLYPVLSLLLLRAMSRAEYKAECSPHWGLSSETYLHFTSPIRRYPDLLVHRAIRWSLGDRADALIEGDELVELCGALSGRERRSVDAERAAVRLFTCLLLRDKLGFEFDGTVSGLGPKGVYVTLAEPPLEVMVQMSDLGSGPYVFDPDLQVLVARRGGAKISLGDAMKVRLVDINLSARSALAERIDD
jgi:ribonuclease R